LTETANSVVPFRQYQITFQALSKSKIMSSERYNPRETEPRWQKVWDQKKLFEVGDEIDW